MFGRFFCSLIEECVWQHLFPGFEAARREIAAWIRWSAGTMRRASTKRWAIGARASSGPTRSTSGMMSGEHFTMSVCAFICPLPDSVRPILDGVSS